MSVFSIDTDKVSAVASDISSLSSSSSSVASSVSGYDTSNEDGFDFSGAKSSLENNVDGMKIKVSNTSVLLDAVVSTHSSLQSSVSDSDSSGSSSYNTYSYGGGGGGSSGLIGGGFGDSRPVTATSSKSSGKTILGKEVAKATSVNLSSLMVSDPLAGEVESALKNNPSAYEKLLDELGKVESKVSKAESTLNEDLSVTLSSNGIKKSRAEGLVAESFSRPLLVIEASSKTIGLTDYIKDVNDVAKNHKIEVRYVELDGVLDNSTTTGSYSENIKDDVLVTKNTNNEEKATSSESEKQNDSTINEDNSITNQIPDEAQKNITIDINSEKEEPNNEEETIKSPETVNEETNENDTQTSAEVDPSKPVEEIINEDEVENKTEESSGEEKNQSEETTTEESKEAQVEKSYLETKENLKTITNGYNSVKEENESKSEEDTETKNSVLPKIDKNNIKNEAEYQRLTNIPTKGNLVNDISKSPTTMIMKNNLITNVMTGIVSKQKIEEFIISSGVDLEKAII